MNTPLDLKEFTLEELTQVVDAWGQPTFRSRQLLKWVYKKGVTDFEEMTDISRAFRRELAQRARLSRLRLVKEQQSQDGCRKFLWTLEDGLKIESVLIPEEDHLTLCLSTQVGCAQGCRFCLTGQRRLVRHLKVSEIVNQILAVRAGLPPGRPLTNLVFMGMGEPLANFPALIRALTIISAPWGLNFSSRRITVSTVGLAPLIPRLGQEVKVNLTVSLNAADDETRSRLMPINRHHPLETLLAACRAFPLPRHRRITFAYVLLDGINDAPAQARQLARLLKGFRAKINLIPFNPHPQLPFLPPPLNRILEFQEILRQSHYPVFIRESRGTDISAACGQLVGE
ncbi:MAG: 23S rRNA (adenine(2503)-C(2))-methyltransferase [Deltaproteobacteria bacterium RBG_13_58_19]|nr:MAG: 23S rRNA (adenine(2503)-C(2))-methyltransferase [Deltaproteobacteria bacterium RBG_13_58_19]